MLSNRQAANSFDFVRRRVLLRGSAAVGALLVADGRADAAAADGVSRTAEAIHQEIVFEAAPARIYAALTDDSQFQKVQSLVGGMPSQDITTHPAMISRDPGGAFSLFGAYIVGRQIELVPNERIVQAWRVQNWPAGIFSIARFALVPQGLSTKVMFDHTGFPNGAAGHLATGWYEHYWEPLKKFLT
jgi:activator of HSP90 ATPase